MEWKYIFLFIITVFFLICSFFINKKKKRLSYVLVTVLLLFLVFVGKFEFIVDFRNYYDLFILTCNNSILAFISGYELGYVGLNFIVSLISSDARLFFFIAYLIFISIYNKVFLEYSDYPIFSLFLFISISFLDVPLRQVLATSFFIYSFKYILNENLKKYLICFLFAFMFHYSSIIMIPVYFLSRYSFKWYTYIIIFFLSFFIGQFVNIYSLFGFFLDFFKKSYGDVDRVGLTTGMLLYVFVFLCCLYGYFMNSFDNKYKIAFNIYFMGLCVYFTFNSVPIVATRGGEFLMTYQFILIPNMLKIFTKGSKLIVVFIFVVLYGYMYIRGVDAVSEYSEAVNLILKNVK